MSSSPYWSAKYLISRNFHYSCITVQNLWGLHIFSLWQQEDCVIKNLFFLFYLNPIFSLCVIHFCNVTDNWPHRKYSNILFCHNENMRTVCHHKREIYKREILPFTTKICCFQNNIAFEKKKLYTWIKSKHGYRYRNCCAIN